MATIPRKKATKTRFTPALAAALALGAKVTGAQDNAEGGEEEEISASEEVEASGETPAPEPTPTTPDTAPAPSTPTPDPAPEPAPAAVDSLNSTITELNSEVATLNGKVASNQGVISHLQTQLDTANSKVGSMSAELANLKSSETQKDADIASLSTIVKASIQRLGIALSSNILGLDALSASNLATQYTELNARFETKFPAARVSHDSGVVEDNADSHDNQLQSAATNATKFKKR